MLTVTGAGGGQPGRAGRCGPASVLHSPSLVRRWLCHAPGFHQSDPVAVAQHATTAVPTDRVGPVRVPWQTDGPCRARRHVYAAHCPRFVSTPTHEEERHARTPQTRSSLTFACFCGPRPPSIRCSATWLGSVRVPARARVWQTALIASPVRIGSRADKAFFLVQHADDRGFYRDQMAVMVVPLPPPHLRGCRS
jgi:hypothetical protein